MSISVQNYIERPHWNFQTLNEFLYQNSETQFKFKNHVPLFHLEFNLKFFLGVHLYDIKNGINDTIDIKRLN